MLPSHAHAYTFGEPLIRSIGPEQMVFDYSQKKCEQWDIPDQPARAFRDDSNKVQLIDSHYNPRRKIGADLASVAHSCTIVLPSSMNADPAKYDDMEWIWSPYTLDGRNVYAIVHDEYRGWTHSGMCLNGSDWTWAAIGKCWYNALTLAKSTNSGASYTHTAAPSHYVAGIPDRYDKTAGPAGVFEPSNIIRRSDGYYYALLRMAEPHQPLVRTCIMRTNNLDSPTSWRAWDGSGYGMRFINPYAETPASRSDHICAALTRDYTVDMGDSVVWSDYLQKYVLVDTLGVEPLTNDNEPGIYLSTSDDLIHWTPAKRLMAAEVVNVSHQCGEPDPIRDPALIDPTSTSRNFETIGRRPFLYFTRFIMTNNGDGTCRITENRDIIRIPIEFTGAPPTAALSATPNPVFRSQKVTFDASASSDAGGSIVTYQWDLDGNGLFEWNTGANPRLTTSFSTVRSGSVGVRVTDNEGLGDDVYNAFTVENRLKYNVQPSAAPLPASFVKDAGAAFSSSRGYGWVRQDSLSSATHVPIDMSRNTRDRDASNVDAYGQELDTFLYMQFPGTNQKFVRTPAAWEIAVPCGMYAVTVSVGDSLYSSSNQTIRDISTHRINVEGQTAIAGFQPSDSTKFANATATVPVCDGKLTIDAIGGTNTKLNYVDINLVDTKVKLNVQPNAAPMPSSFLKDTGAPYGSSRGYGWVRQDSLASATHTPLDLTRNTRDRDASNVDAYGQELDTFIYMQFPGTNQNFVRIPGAWEMAVPCGTYAVTVSVGDSLYSSSNQTILDVSTHRINVEGQTPIAGFRPSDSIKFASATATVSVCDGRLTVSAIGGTNTKLNYVTVAAVG